MCSNALIESIIKIKIGYPIYNSIDTFAHVHRYVHYRDIFDQHGGLRYRHDDGDAVLEVLLHVRRDGYIVSLHLRDHILRQLSSVRRETIDSEKEWLLLPAVSQLAIERMQ